MKAKAIEKRMNKMKVLNSNLRFTLQADRAWEWTTLFTEVSSELQTELEERAAKANLNS